MSGNVIDVINSFNKLDKDIQTYVAYIFEEISEISKTMNMELLTDMTNKLQKIKDIQLQLTNSKDEFLKLDSEADTNNDNTKILDNTFKWEVENSNIRTITRRPNDTFFSNLLPISVFKDITTQALLIYKQKGYVKSSEIDKVLGDKIIKSSNYKDSKTLISKALKILTHENIILLDSNNSRKYLFNVIDISKINNWLEKLQSNNGYIAFSNNQL